MSCNNMDDHVKNILTYDDSTSDIVINYSVLLVDMIPLVLLMQALPSNYGVWRYAWVLVLIFLFILQVGLCLWLDCTGISVIWSAMCGLNVVCFSHFVDIDAYTITHTVWLKYTVGFSTVCSIIVWIYYAVVETMLTSVAHVCAALLGCLLAKGYIRLVRKCEFYPVYHQRVPLIPTK